MLKSQSLRVLSHDPDKAKWPSDDKTTSEIILDYANDQSHWLENFVPAFEKMVRNGYKESDLTTAPKSWVGYKCYKSSRYGVSCG